MKKIRLSKQNITLAIIIMIVLILDITILGFLKFGYNVVRCGGLPVQVRQAGFGSSSVYTLPAQYTPGGAGNEYLCTEQEALERRIPKNIYN